MDLIFCFQYVGGDLDETLLGKNIYFDSLQIILSRKLSLFFFLTFLHRCSVHFNTYLSSIYTRTDFVA